MSDSLPTFHRNDDFTEWHNSVKKVFRESFPTTYQLMPTIAKGFDKLPDYAKQYKSETPALSDSDAAKLGHSHKQHIKEEANKMVQRILGAMEPTLLSELEAQPSVKDAIDKLDLAALLTNIQVYVIAGPTAKEDTGIVRLARVTQAKQGANESVSEYHTRFTSLVNVLKATDPNVSEATVTGSFLGGLKQESRHLLELYTPDKPRTLSDAFQQALIWEQKLANLALLNGGNKMSQSIAMFGAAQSLSGEEHTHDSAQPATSFCYLCNANGFPATHDLAKCFRLSVVANTKEFKTAFANANIAPALKSARSRRERRTRTANQANLAASMDLTDVEQAVAFLTLKGIHDEPLLALDTGATSTIYHVRDGLIMDSPSKGTLYVTVADGRKLSLTQSCSHPIWGPGWFYPEGLLTLLSWNQLAKRGWSMASDGATRIRVTSANGSAEHIFSQVSDDEVYLWEPHFKGLGMSVEGVSVGVKQAVQFYHSLLLHPNDEVLERFFASGDIADWPKSKPSPSQIHQCLNDAEECHTCSLAKMTLTKPFEREKKPCPIGQSLHMDIVFPLGATFLLAKDQTSGFLSACELSDKSLPSIQSAMRLIINSYKSYGHEVKTISTDHEAVFEATRADLLEQLVHLSTRAPGVHEKVVERDYRTLLSKMRTIKADLLRDGRVLPDAAIPHLFRYALRIMNLTPNKHSGDRIPFAMVTGKPVSIHDMQVPFGAIVIAKVPPLSSGKKPSMALRGQYGFVLGHGIDGHGKIRMLLIENPKRAFIVERHVYKQVLPDEHVRKLLSAWTSSTLKWPPEANESEPETTDGSASWPQISDGIDERTNDDYRSGESHSFSSSLDTGSISNVTHTASSSAPNNEIVTEVTPSNTIGTEAMPTLVTETTPTNAATEVPSSTSATGVDDSGRSGRPRRAVARNWDYGAANSGSWQIKSNSNCMAIEEGQDPIKVEGEALIAFSKLVELDSTAAHEALRKEINQLVELNSFLPVHASQVPSKDLDQAISSILVGAIKPSGHKVRLAARGDLQKIPDNYPTSSPTLPMWALYGILAIAACRGLKIRTHDVICAYPNADIDSKHPVFMWLAPMVAKEAIRLRPEWAEFQAHDGRLLVRLNKALYGLVDSGLRWHENITNTILADLGLDPVITEPNVFHRGVDTLLGKFVDDLIVIYADETEADQIRDGLRKKYPFGIKTQHGPTVEFLGLRIEHLSEHNLFLVSQPKLINKLQSSYSPDLYSKLSCRVPARSDLFSRHDFESPLADVKMYGTLLGELAYLTRTRPDICVATSYLQSFASKPTEQNLQDLFRLLGYVMDTAEYGLVIAPDLNKTFAVHASADSSYACRFDGKSQGGSIITLNGTPIDWMSNKIALLADSSTRAEIAQADLTMEPLDAVRDFLIGLGIELEPSMLMQDNQSAMTVCIDGFSNAITRSRPWLVRVVNVKEHLLSGDLTLEYQPTENMAADGLTKPLPPGPFKGFRDRMNVFDLREIRLTGRAGLSRHGGVLDVSTPFQKNGKDGLESEENGLR